MGRCNYGLSYKKIVILLNKYGSMWKKRPKTLFYAKNLHKRPRGSERYQQ